MLIAQALRFGAGGEKIIASGADMVSTEVLEFQGANYDLCSVFEHVGKSSNSGHYYGFGKDMDRKIWYKMDDSRVTVSSFSQARRSPYIAFYQGCQILLRYPPSPPITSFARAPRVGAQSSAPYVGRCQCFRPVTVSVNIRWVGRSRRNSLTKFYAGRNKYRKSP